LDAHCGLPARPRFHRARSELKLTCG
jgi:hypothetical protein